MRRTLLATTFLTLVSSNAYAQGCLAPPPQAAAAGYTTPVLTDNFTGNTVQPAGASGGIYNWYPVDGLTNYSEGNGQLQINTDNSGFGAGLTTYPGNGTNAALSTPGSPAVNTGNGVVYQYGYFQATFSFNPNGYVGTGDWPAFWLGHAMDGPSNPSGNFTEIDAFEGIPGWPPKAGVPAQDTSTVLEWTPGNGQMLAQGAFNPTQNIDFTKPNTFGLLWTPTAISVYVNNVPQSTIPIGPGTPYPSAAIDYANLILGTGYNWPVTFNSVDIWQSGQLPGGASSGSGSSGVTPCAPTATASVTANAPIQVAANTVQAAPTTGTPTTAPAPLPAPAQSSQATPSNGTVKDCSGNTYLITANGSVLENGSIWVPGGGGTQALQVQGCTVYGEGIGTQGWFTLSGDGQAWSHSSAPSGAIGQASSATAATAGVSSSAKQPAMTSVSGCAALQQLAFGILNGQIYAPNGQAFIPRGINVGPGNMGAATPQTLKAMFSGINFVRFATWYSSPTMAAEEAYVTSLTQAGIIVEVEDHAYPSPGVYSGAELQAESAWYAQWAADFKNNPNVWFGTMNEPGGGTSPGAISDQELATYQAIRGTGSNAILMLELYGGGNPGTIGLPGGMSGADYANMSNVAWDLHFYGWSVNFSSDAGTISAALTADVQQAQTITGAGGSMIPVIVGEFGDSTSGASVDPDGAQVVNGVLTSGLGYAAWTWGGYGGPDQLTQGGGLTAFGQQVAAAITATDTAGGAASGCAVTAAAAGITATAIIGASATAATTTDPTMQGQIDAAQAQLTAAEDDAAASAK